MNEKIEKVLIETNQTCNLNCKYCFYNDIGRSNNILSLNDIKKIVKKYPNIKEFYLTGGECTLNDEFASIIECLSLNGKICIFTNGINFEKESNLKLINLIDKMIITFDSNNEKYNLRNNKENLILENIKKIASINSNKLEVKICLNKLNNLDFESTIKLLINNGVKHLSINYIKNIKSNSMNFELSNEEILSTFKIIEKYIKYFDKENIDFIIKSYKNNFKNKVFCIAGIKFIYIDCHMNEYLCPSCNKCFNSTKNNDCFGIHCINLWEMFK